MEKLTKKERKELRQQEALEEAFRKEKQTIVKKFFLWGTVVTVLVVSIIFLINVANNSSPTSSPPAGGSLTFPVSQDEAMKGNPQAKVTIIEYSDFQCPACAAYYPMTKQLMNEYKDRVRFVYRHFPLTSIHKNAMFASKAAYGAHLQGKFWEYHDILFEKQLDWAQAPNAEELLETYATQAGLDLPKFKTDIQNPKTEDFIRKDLASGVDAGVAGTPTFFVNGKKIDNPRNFTELKNIVENALKNE